MCAWMYVFLKDLREMMSANLKRSKTVWPLVLGWISLLYYLCIPLRCFFPSQAANLISFTSLSRPWCKMRCISAIPHVWWSWTWWWWWWWWWSWCQANDYQHHHFKHVNMPKSKILWVLAPPPQKKTNLDTFLFFGGQLNPSLIQPVFVQWQKRCPPRRSPRPSTS